MTTMTPTTALLLLALVICIPTLLPRLLQSPQFRAYLNRRRTRNGTYKSTQQSSEITSLRVYPIKSCRGFETTSTTQCMTGLDLDRLWMIVDEKTHVFLTIRQIPEMTLISTGYREGADGGELVISIDKTEEKHGGSIAVPSHPSESWLSSNTTLAHDLKIWDTTTDGYVYNNSVGINQLLSRFLNRSVVLVYKGPSPRILKGNGDPRVLGRVQNTNFPDVLPVLIASQASIDELNSRLRKQGHEEISIERFRPNIIIRGTGEGWIEDSWKTVRISEFESEPLDASALEKGSQSPSEGLTYDIVARCGRCQVPNVDPVTAEKHKTQPWDTMMAYRRVDEGLKYKPCFGMLGVPREEGSIRVGMRFEVLEETSEHRYIKGF
ncbi:MOSC domain-containing protein [Aspergillus stella-maris]|uniref:MOSC domain-containing protein n=1 Tax=Aspergillus stella-maris TaxID=1810926 RepID=UPI003CCDF637